MKKNLPYIHVCFPTFGTTSANYFTFHLNSLRASSLKVLIKVPLFCAIFICLSGISVTKIKATANLAGPFVYTPAAGTIPGGGNHHLATFFTPTNTSPYNTASASVNININKINLLVKANDQRRLVGAANPASTGNYLGENVRIVVLGSSTAAGTGASSPAYSWVGLLTSRLTTDYPGLVTVTNLGIGGYTTYHILPTGTNNGGFRPAVDQTRNITAALALKPQVILINMPTNDVANGFTDTETINNFATIIYTAKAAGVKVLLTGTQPRNDAAVAQPMRLKTQNQELLRIYGTECINIYDELTDFTNNGIKSQYSHGDKVHLNNAGHAYIYSRMSGPVKTWIEAYTSGLQMQTITFPPIPIKIYGDPPFSLNATSSSGLSPYYRIIMGPATVTGNMLSIIGAGTVTVRAYHPGNNQYLAATPVDVSFNVLSSSLKQSQGISFTTLPTRTFGEAAFTLSARASSGLPVGFNVHSGPAIIAGNTITLTGAGIVTVRATQAGNTIYAAAKPVDQTFTVNKASQNIAFANLPNKTFGDAPFALSATATSGLPVTFSIFSGPATVLGNVVTLTGVGTVTVRAAQAGNINYNLANNDKIFTVNRAVQPLTTCSIALTGTSTQAESWYGMWGSTAGAGAIDLTVSGGTAPYNYKWNTGVTTQDISMAAPGQYSVTVTDAKGCTAKTTIYVSRKNEPFKLGVSQKNVSAAGRQDGSINLSVIGGGGSFKYRWSNGAITEDLTNLATGTYTVVVSDAFGLTATISVQLLAPVTTTIATAKKLTINETFMDRERDFTVYPNPAKDQLSVNFCLPATGTYTIELYDIRGAKTKTIAAGQAKANKMQTLKMNLTGFAEGIYLLKFKTYSETTMRRISVLK